MSNHLSDQTTGKAAGPESLTFLHLSDIHFNKKWMDHYDLDYDLRDQLERSVTEVRKRFEKVQGILIGGDIAFSGKKDQYDVAVEWLKRLCTSIDCRETDVWCVPGNHDVDRQVYKDSKLLRISHEELRPNDPFEVDDKIAELLRDRDAARILFTPLEQYNAFAANYSCQSRAAPLAWQHDKLLNDGSCLRIYGINSTLISNHLDDNQARKLIVGTIQSRPREEDGVTYLAMCHHPLDWLFDYEAVGTSLCARAKVQLFGHKHFQVVDRINDCLRIGAGAVHPSRRDKQWQPRYNWLDFKIKNEGGRSLEVDVWPMVWQDSAAKFVFDYAACDGQEHKIYSISMPPWKATSTDVSQIVGVKATPELTLVPPTNVDAQRESDAARMLAYRFLELPHVSRILIAQELDLYRDEDEGVLDPELFELMFARANSAGTLNEFWDKIQEAHGSSTGESNPYDMD